MEYKLLPLALLFSVSYFQGVQSISGGTSINNDNRNNFRYVAMIHARDTQCSGFVVTNMAVLTAASCFDSLNGDFSTVYVMNVGGGVVHVHQDYNRETKENDIALILLNNPTTFQQGITLASEDPMAGAECVATGFGATQPDGEITMTAQYENVFITDCDGYPASRVCAGAKGDTDVHGVLCLGDVGAPLICNNELVGIALSESSCGTGDSDQYQDIINVKQWIESLIQ